MLRFCLVIFGGALLLAQQTSAKFDFCGLGSKRECNCASHVEQVRERYIKACKDSGKSGKDLDACLRETPAHCNIVDRYTDERTLYFSL